MDEIHSDKQSDRSHLQVSHPWAMILELQPLHSLKGACTAMAAMHYTLELRRTEGLAFSSNNCGICVHATEVTVRAFG